MFFEVFKFELRYRLRQPLFYLLLVAFFFMAFGAISTDSVQLGGSIGKVARNAPMVLVFWITILSSIGLLVVTAYVATVVNRDHELGTQEMFLATPVRKGPYLLGRFAGSVVLTLMILSASALGFYVGSIMPFQNPEYIVPFQISPYLFGLCVMALPNLILSGAIFFTIATLTRRILLTYVAVVAFFALWGISGAFLGDLEDEVIPALCDPFGISALKLLTRYWTVAERNAMNIPLEGTLLLNRLVWLGVGAAFLGFTLMRFRMGVGERKGRRQRIVKQAERNVRIMPASEPMPAVTPTFELGTTLSQWWHQTRIETRGILLGIPFLVLMIFGAGNLLGGIIANPEGTISYPVTRVMLRDIRGAFELFLMLSILVYAGSLVFKERTARMQEVYGALPMSGWVPLMAKLTALAAMIVTALLVAMVTCIVYQAAMGYYQFELGLYFKDLFLRSLSWWLLVAVLCFFLQVLTNNRYVGFLLAIVYLTLIDVFPAMGWSHHLYLYGTTPTTIYSDMNGYGHYVAPLVWFKLYWGTLAVIMIVLCRMLWVRGTEESLRMRLRIFFSRMTRPRLALIGASAAVFVLLGGWIYYNTNILNEYLNEDGENRLRAEYEKRYKQYEDLPQPRLATARVEADLYPRERRADFRGQLTLENRTDETVDQLHLVLEREVGIRSMSLSDEALVTNDEEVGYRIYRLDDPLEPGERMQLDFDFFINTEGFKNHGSDTRLVKNGTFLNNTHFVPHIGYNRRGEMTDPKERKEFDLPERQRLPPADDLKARRNMAFTHDADWIDFECFISTDEGQSALAPGYLMREWTEGGRRYYHYKMDAPIVNMYSFLSADYEVKRDLWEDVKVAIYFHKDHAYNVDRMIESIQKSLDYYSTNYSPFQHRQMRILEFPGYASFAQSFPNTVPYSEAAHFVDDLRDRDKIDMVFYITAHEVAHQWWAHQVNGSDVQGSTFIIEAMAQYSALMVMEKEYGPDRMQKFLAYELHNYLRGRGTERIEEKPLLYVEDQPYIHYHKGSLAMYALREYIGEKRLNSALSRFIEDKAFQGPPYTTSLEFISYIREVTPEKYLYLLEDLFETITLYDNRAMEATYTTTEDGRYKVKLAYKSRKLRADGDGMETEIDHDDWIEIGVFGEIDRRGKKEEITLYIDKHRLASGEAEIEIMVDDLPVRAGIDPRNLLIDRVPDDNVKSVSG